MKKQTKIKNNKFQLYTKSRGQTLYDTTCKRYRFRNGFTNHKNHHIKYIPKYYAKSVVEFFLQHHKQDNILEDIQNGCVWLLETDGYFAGTVTIKENAVNRLFVLPEYQSHGFESRPMDFAEDKIVENYSQIHIDSSLAAKEMYIKRGFMPCLYYVIITEIAYVVNLNLVVNYGLCFKKSEKR